MWLRFERGCGRQEQVVLEHASFHQVVWVYLDIIGLLLCFGAAHHREHQSRPPHFTSAACKRALQQLLERSTVKSPDVVLTYHLAFSLAFCVTMFVALFLASDLAYTLTFFPWQRGKYSDHIRLTTWWLRLERVVNMSI